MTGRSRWRPPAPTACANADSWCSGDTNLIRGAPPLGLPYTLSRAPLRRRAPFAWLARHARSRPRTDVQVYETASSLIRRLRPSDSPTRSLARRCAGALRSRGSLAMLARDLGPTFRFMRQLLVLSDGFAPRTPLHALSRAAAPARSVRVARSPCSLATEDRRSGL